MMLIERDDFTVCSEVMVELSTRMREIRGDGGNHHENMELERISCMSQLTIPDTAGTGHDPADNDTDTRSSGPNHEVVLLISHSRLYPPYRSHLHPPSLSFLSTTLPSSQEHKVKSSLCISPCHHHELTLSAAYTEYSIQQRLSVIPHQQQT
jgi:hypothetical protein